MCCSSRSKPSNSSKKSPEAEDTAKAWAAEVIQKQKGKYLKIFIAEHYQWFDGRNGKANWYEHWKDFCDKYGVTMALSGNNHIYERTHPLQGDKVVPGGQGTVCLWRRHPRMANGNVEAGKLTMNADKLAFTYSSHQHSNKTEVKTIGCVLVHVSPKGDCDQVGLSWTMAAQCKCSRRTCDEPRREVSVKRALFIMERVKGIEPSWPPLV